MKLFSDLPGDDGLPGRERRVAMAAVQLGTIMAVLDGSIVNVALPTMARALRVNPADAIWIANGYLLATATTLVIFASLSGLIGFRRVYVAGLIAFTVSSLGCALARSLEMLTVLRVIQGLGGAAMFSVGPAIYRTVFPGRLLGTVLGLNAVTVATSSAVGPTLGGALLATLSWPWLFAINVPIGGLAIFLALRALPHHQRATAPGTIARLRDFDFIGAILSTIAMGSIILVADASAHLDEAPARHEALICAVAALIAGTLFIRRQRRTPFPLLPLDIFQSPRFSLATLTSLFSFSAQGITFVALPFLFQGAFGYSALMSALLFTPWPIGIVLAAPFAGRLADKYAAAFLSTAGLAVLSIGLILLALLPAHATVIDICWRGVICGIGFGFFQSPNNREIMGSAPRSRTHAASGVLGIARTYGQSLGAAAVAFVLAIYTQTHRGAGVSVIDAHAAHIALFLAAAVAAIAAVISAARIRHRAA